MLAVSGWQDSPAPVLTGTMQAAAVKAINAGAAIGLVDVDGHPHLVAASAFSDADAGNNVAQTRTRRTSSDSSPAPSLPSATTPCQRARVPQRRRTCYPRGMPPRGDHLPGRLGLEETGLVNFRQTGMLSAAPASVVSYLAQEHNLPYLTGMTVVLVGVGDTASPQVPLAISQQNNVVAIWSAIAKAAGATSVRADPAPLSGPAPAHAPAVSLVAIPPISPAPNPRRAGRPA